MTADTPGKKHFAIHINEERCKSCQYCISVCPVQALKLSKKFNAQGYEVVTPTAVRCSGCLRCVSICPDFVITILSSEEA